MGGAQGYFGVKPDITVLGKCLTGGYPMAGRIGGRRDVMMLLAGGIGNTFPGMVRKAFRRGANAALLGERLLCLGMTCDRVLFNTELYEKCARAYVLAKATGNRIWLIPQRVRLIANRRLLKDERRPAASYRKGSIPEGTKAY